MAPRWDSFESRAIAATATKRRAPKKKPRMWRASVLEAGPTRWRLTRKETWSWWRAACAPRPGIMRAHHARNSSWFAIPCNLLSWNRGRRVRRSPTTARSTNTRCLLPVGKPTVGRRFERRTHRRHSQFVRTERGHPLTWSAKSDTHDRICAVTCSAGQSGRQYKYEVGGNPPASNSTSQPRFPSLCPKIESSSARNAGGVLYQQH